MKHAIYKCLISELRGTILKPTGEQVPVETSWDEYLQTSDLTFYYPKGFLEEVEKVRGHSQTKLIQMGVVPVPGETEARLITDKLFKTFGEKLSLCGDVFQKTRTPGSLETRWALSVTTKQYRQGVIVPARTDNRITHLKVYRNLTDKNPVIMGREDMKRAA